MVNTLNRRVLLLNKTYEPISIMGVQQVMKKLLKPDSVFRVEKWSDGVLHSPKGEYRVPSIVIRTHYIDIRKRKEKSGSKRLSIYRRDNFHCMYCGKRITDLSKLTLDHIYPKSRGGKNTPDNLVTSCKPCNHTKGDRTPEEAKMPLLVSRKSLKVRLDTIQKTADLDRYPEWEGYLFLSKDAKSDERYHLTGT